MTETATTIQPFKRAEVRLGTMDSRGVFIDIEVKDTAKGPELSISGHHGNWSWGQIQDIVKLLALRAAARDGSNLAKGISIEDIGRIVTLWERWHLNGMLAGCEHQRALGWRPCPGHYGAPGKTCSHPDPEPATPEQMEAAYAELARTGVAMIGGSSYYRCAEDKLSQPCPECGYKYGSAWLYEPLPVEVAEFLRTVGTGEARS